jgi:hypothetical protein
LLLLVLLGRLEARTGVAAESNGNDLAQKEMLKDYI